MIILKVLSSPVTSNLLSATTIILVIYGYTQWKKIYIAERQSNNFLNIAMDINRLYFSILEQRQPEFRPSHNDDFIKYIDDYKIPPLMEIAKQAYVISKEISILEKTLTLPKKNDQSLTLSSLYYQYIIKEIIKKITLNIHLYYADKKRKQEQLDPTQTELYKFLYPSSFAVDPNQYEFDDKTGLNIIKDDFYEVIITGFNSVLSALDNLLIK
ncbi:hypothetical protein DGG96_08940 [Legionella qingyii]|uniref:Uncharacterized protein n=1 Tax=Legionella qingyii TaxID=2184757 RepID=A0A317U1X9_9GAMM|nr:hypothetical protein [Legionella qingyii]PWY56053.1 hypothetical protein DGG96_08940 [Legionella qingyii]RUR22056.1 hypothetical protein ELY20_10860 [Legionella qingyii]RUR25636.1 hypothetical protein ELY16_09670 [Legionella qingyii]